MIIRAEYSHIEVAGYKVIVEVFVAMSILSRRYPRFLVFLKVSRGSGE